MAKAYVKHPQWLLAAMVLLAVVMLSNGQNAATRPPAGVTLGNAGQRTIEFQFFLPAKTFGNSTLAYRVGWNTVNCNTPSGLCPCTGYTCSLQGSIIVHSTVTSASGEVNRLRDYTTYALTVTQVDDVGKPFGRTVSSGITTLESPPGPVSNLTVTAVSNSSLLLTWLSPAEPNGIITQYGVSYLLGGSIRNITLPSTAGNVTLSNLPANGTFAAVIYAMNAAGTGVIAAAQLGFDSISEAAPKPADGSDGEADESSGEDRSETVPPMTTGVAESSTAMENTPTTLSTTDPTSLPVTTLPSLPTATTAAIPTPQTMTTGIPTLPTATTPIPSLLTTTTPIPSLPTTTTPIPSLPTTTTPIPSLPTTTTPIPSLPTTTTPIPSLPTTTTPIPSLPATTTPIPSLPTTTTPIPSLPTTTTPIPSLPTTTTPIPSLPATTTTATTARPSTDTASDPVTPYVSSAATPARGGHCGWYPSTYGSVEIVLLYSHNTMLTTFNSSGLHRVQQHISVDTRIVVMCSEGTYVQGDPPLVYQTVICQQNGMWTRELASCIEPGSSSSSKSRKVSVVTIGLVSSACAILVIGLILIALAVHCKRRSAMYRLQEKQHEENMETEMWDVNHSDSYHKQISKLNERHDSPRSHTEGDDVNCEVMI